MLCSYTAIISACTAEKEPLLLATGTVKLIIFQLYTIILWHAWVCVRVSDLASYAIFN